MKMMLFSAVAVMAVMLVSVHAGAEKKADDVSKEDLDATIAHLLEYVRTSDVVFIRNGKEHSAEDAEGHIKKKYNHYKKKIKTPEDFIEKSATKSMMSGKLYQIRLKDGTVMTSKDWLLAELERYRNPPAKAAVDTASVTSPDTLSATPHDTASVAPADTTPVVPADTTRVAPTDTTVEGEE